MTVEDVINSLTVELSKEIECEVVVVDPENEYRAITEALGNMK